MISYVFFYSAVALISTISLFYRIKGLQLVYMLSIFFVSFRFETGNDWMVYKDLYLNVPDIFNMSLENMMAYIYFGQHEPVIIVLSSLLKVFSDDFQVIISVISIFNITVFYFFIKRNAGYNCCLFSSCILFFIFTLYFSVLRQSLSVSFFYIFYMTLFSHKRTGKVFLLILLFILSLLSQASSLIYYFILLFSTSRFSKVLSSRYYCCLIYFSILFVLSGKSFGAYLLNSMVFMEPVPIVGSKIVYYAAKYSGAGFNSVNIMDLAFVVMVSTIFPIFVTVFHKSNELPKNLEVMKNICLIYVLLQVCLYDIPLLRNRVQYVALPMLFIIMSYISSNVSKKFSQFVSIGLLLISSSYYFAFLKFGESSTFIPYQWYFYHVLTDDKGSGKERTEDMLIRVFN